MGVDREDRQQQKQPAEKTADAFEDGVDHVQITFVDPKSGNICRRDVFCDPGDWAAKVRPRSRFLISSNLVNLLNEAVSQRHVRWKTRYDGLANYRFGYECVLWTLRNDLTRLAAVLDLDAGKTDGANSDGEAPEVCPIHFYRPDCYLDNWTLERIDLAVKRYSGVLHVDIQELSERIKQCGGSGWYDIMKKVVGTDGAESEEEVKPETPGGSTKSMMAGIGQKKKKKKLPPKQTGPKIDILVVAQKLYDETSDEDRRNLENKLSGGCRDLRDRLLPIVKGLEPTFEDYSQRNGEVQMELGRKTEKIESCEARLKIVRKKLEQPPPHIRPDSDSEISEDEPIDESAFWARVAQLIKELFDEWAAKIRQAMEEFSRAKKNADDWEGKYKAFDKSGELSALKAEVAALEASVAKCQSMLAKLIEKADAARRTRDEKLRQLADLKGEADDLAGKIGDLPPPSPRSMKYQELQEQLKKLEGLYERLKDKLKNPGQRVKSIRYQLKKLFEQYSWEWEYSDSEGEDDNEQPYWVRRKLAAEGMAKFNPNHFIYAERTFHKRRLKTKEKKHQEKQESAIFGQMVARRHLHSEHVATLMQKEAGKRPAGSTDRDLMVAPFATDCGELKAVDPVERAMESFQSYLASRSIVDTKLSSVHTSSDAMVIQGHCAKLIRLHHARASCLHELRQAAQGLPGLLPEDGALADPKVAYEMDMLDDMDDIDAEIQGVCSSIQDAIGKVIRCSDKVGPIATTLQHSMKLSELQSRFTNLCAERQAALADLREVAGEDVFQSCSTRLPSMQGSLLELDRELSISFQEASMSSSPCPRTSPTSRGGGTVAPLGRHGGPPSLLPPPRSSARCTDPLLGSPTAAASGGRNVLSPCVLGSAAGAPSRARTAKGTKEEKEVIDFGFRPDGVGEEPLENWSLFKVSKGDRGAGQGQGQGGGGGGGDGGTSPGGNARCVANDKVPKLSASKLQQRLAAHCDFREYVSQQKESLKEMWQSASAPDLAIKRGPSLPQLVQGEKKSGGDTKGSGGSRGLGARSKSGLLGAGRGGGKW